MSLKEIIYRHISSRKIFVTLVTMGCTCGLGVAAGLDKHLGEVLFALLTAGGFHAAGHAFADFTAAKGVADADSTAADSVAAADSTAAVVTIATADKK